MTKYLCLLVVALFTVSCGDESPTAPSREPAPQPQQATGQNSRSWKPADVVAADGSSVTFDGPGPGCQPSSEAVDWTIHVNAQSTIRLFPHAFRSSKAGCENTTEQQTVLEMDGRTQYDAGQSGENHIHWFDQNACGRVELGVIAKNADGADTMVTWRVVNSGKDCPEPEPPVVPPPVPPVTPPVTPPSPPLDPCVVDQLCDGKPTPPPPPGVPRDVPPEPVSCPVITVENWRDYVLQPQVTHDYANFAVAHFKINLPVGCTIPLSLVSYQPRVCGEKYPQRFVHGSDPRGTEYGGGVWGYQMRVYKETEEYQVDLRFGGFEWEHELTQENDQSYYGPRTIAWLYGGTCSGVDGIQGQGNGLRSR